MGIIRRLLKIVVLGRKEGYRRRLFRRILRGGETAPAAAAEAVPPAAAPDASGWVDVAGVAELPPGQVMEIRVDDRALALANVEGQLHAVDGICLHAGGPLGDGAVEGATVVCPYHGWGFDLTSGRCLVDEQLQLARYPVRIAGGRILVSGTALPA